MAKFAETVDFPTPPLPEATAIMFFTFFRDDSFFVTIGVMFFIAIFPFILISNILRSF